MTSHIVFAGIVTIIWALHPIQVSTVAYIVQRMTILATLFSLMSILFYLAGRIILEDNSIKAAILLIISLFFLLLGVFCKENAILTLLFLFYLEFYLLQTKYGNLQKFILPKYILFLVFIPLLLTLVFYHQEIKDYFVQGYAIRSYDLSDRLLTQPRIIASYIHWYYFPNVQNLALFHDDITISNSLLQPISTLFSIGFLFSLLLAGFYIRNKFPIISIGIFWFFMFHLLESTALPLEMVYEHRNYLPSIGLTLIFVELIRLLFSKLKFQISYQILSIAIVVFMLFFLTYSRSVQWSSSFSLYYFETLHHPNSPRANYALGREYLNLAIAGETTSKQDAHKYLSKAALVDSNRISPEAALIFMANELNESASPKLITSMSKKLSQTPIDHNKSDMLSELVKCDINRCLLPHDASSYLIDSALSNATIEDSPYYSSILNTKALFLLNSLGKKKEAEYFFKKSITVSPNKTKLYINYISFLISDNRIKDARNYLQIAYQTDPLGRYKEKLSNLKHSITNQ